MPSTNNINNNSVALFLAGITTGDVDNNMVLPHPTSSDNKQPEQQQIQQQNGRIRQLHLLQQSVQPFLEAFGAAYHPSHDLFTGRQSVETTTTTTTKTTTSTNDDDDDDDDDDVNMEKTSKKTKYTSQPQKQQKQRSCIGHKERVLGCDFSECGTYLATASQESNVRIWKVSTNQLLSTIPLDVKYEALRVAWASSSWTEMYLSHCSCANDSPNSTTNKQYKYILATCGADGITSLYGTSHPESTTGSNDWTCLLQLDHTQYKHFRARASIDPEDKPQIYSLQFIGNFVATTGANAARCILLTSSDDHLHLWESSDLSWNSQYCDTTTKVEQANSALLLSNNDVIRNEQHMTCPTPLQELFSVCFTAEYDDPQKGYGVSVCSVTDDRSTESAVIPTEDQKSMEDLELVESSDVALGRGVFGGERNPLKLIYIFDASYCSSNGLLCAALSDGTLRILNSAGGCLSILHLPGNESHLTSFCWDSTGQILATCVGSGHLVTWTIEKENVLYTSVPDGNDSFEYEQLRPTLRAVFSGGHDLGSPLFGAAFICTKSERLFKQRDGADSLLEENRNELLISWSSDGRVCLWESQLEEEVPAPISILHHQPDYPIYAMASVSREQSFTTSPPSYVMTLAVAGGGSQGGFIGVPVYLYDIQL